MPWNAQICLGLLHLKIFIHHKCAAVIVKVQTSTSRSCNLSNQVPWIWRSGCQWNWYKDIVRCFYIW